MRKLALITGASAGIGEAFARKYAELGCDLILSARREDRLLQIAKSLGDEFGIEAICLPLDLSDVTAPEDVARFVASLNRPLDILVNNAGYGLPGTFAETSWADQKDFLQIMLTAPAELCHRLIPGMVERGYGRVINVASVAGMTPGGAGHTLYGPVKSALIGLSESLNAETRGTGVHVTALCPGLTYSEFHDVNGQRDRVNKVPKTFWQSAEAVVDTAIKASEANRPVVVTGLANKAIAGLMRILPGGLSRRIVREQSAGMSK